ncbi:MAG: hypothetical protein EZS28_000160 [Streblomastix strix]|uniref:Uncharacterized protein n=1 Tax=Streblomastix strix TaxID=222440 RepID=A0A5J4XAJ1_9EUKA|nr:MAG: hypothetical protein EZS28_000160 [Streblomastix strix]
MGGVIGGGNEQTVSQRKGRRSYRKRDTRLSDSEQSQRRIKTDRRMKDTSDDDVDDDQDELLDMDDDEDDDELMQEEEQIADEEQDNDIGKIDSVIDVNNNIVETSPHDETGDKLGAIHKDEYLRNLSSLSTITSSFAAHFMFSSSQYSQQNQVPFSKYKRHINYFIIPPQLAQQTLISWVSGGNYDNQGAVVHRLRNKKSGIIITQATVKQKNPNFNQNSNQISNSNLATNGKDKQNNQQRKYSIGGSGLVSGERDILNQRERGSGTAQSAQSQNSQQQQQQSNKKVVNGDLWCECGGWAGKQRVSWSQTGFFDGIGANDDLLVLEIGVGKKDENVDQQYIQQQKMKVGMEKDSDADQLNNIEQIKNMMQTQITFHLKQKKK